MNEKFYPSPSFLRSSNYYLLSTLFVVFLICGGADFIKLPAVYLAGILHFQLSNFVSFLLWGFFILALLSVGIRTKRAWQQSYLELTNKQIIRVGQQPFTLPYSEIKSWEIISNPNQKIIDVVLWYRGRKYHLQRFAPLEKLVAALELALTEKPTHTAQPWLASYPTLFTILPLPFVLWALFTRNGLLLGLASAVLPLIYLLLVVCYRTFYQKFTLTESGRIWGLVGVIFLLVTLNGFTNYRDNFTFQTCTSLTRLMANEGCIRKFYFEAEVLGFTADSQALVLGNPQFSTGTLIQPIHSWFPQLNSYFFPASAQQTLTLQSNKLFAYDSSQTQLESWNIALGQKETVYRFSGKTVLAISPAGRYFLASEQNQLTLVESATGQETLLPVKPRLATFSADEQTLFLLTRGELVIWDIKTETIQQTLPIPEQGRGVNSLDCLRFKQEGQLLLVVNDTEFWQWDMNQNKVQKLLTTFQFDCEFLSGPDWLFTAYKGIYAQLHDLNSGQLVWRTEQLGYMNSWAVSPDGRYLAGSDRDYTYLFDFELLRQQQP